MHSGGQKYMELVYRSWTSSTQLGRPIQMQTLFHRNPQSSAPKEGIGEDELQVTVVHTEPVSNIDTLLQAEPITNTTTSF